MAEACGQQREEVPAEDEDLAKHLLTKTDGCETKTTRMQIELEERIIEILQDWEEQGEDYDINTQLYRTDHISFCYSGLQRLPGFYVSLDASRPWIVFWILHSLSLLDGLSHLDKKTFNGCITFLQKCQDPAGGFGGGPGQIAHLAPTYAAVAALMTLGTQEAYDAIDREKMYKYLMRMKQPNGAFAVHEDGEIDIRGTYTALATAGMLNLLTPELTKDCAEWLSSCQTYEGGMGGEPGLEAHGGYAYCGLAALAIINRYDLIDMESFVHWACARQMKLEGGFQGRTNKLVDACYSFWVGGLFPLIHHALETFSEEQKSDEPSQASSSSHKRSEEPVVLPSQWIFDVEELQKYVLVCCQQDNGGLRDKPGKLRDYYHTCYALSGLSVSQHDLQQPYSDGKESDSESLNILGSPGNILKETDAMYNVEITKLRKSMAYFNQLPQLDGSLSDKSTKRRKT